ncbi:MAG: DUF3050 domain-containing protein [Chitinophagaceae bacterium]
MQDKFNQLRGEIDHLRQEIINHRVYKKIQTADDLKIFMQFHVFAVWDFMSLLKSLQNHLTCTTVPWFPTGSAETRFLINEIVVGEESDVDMNGQRISHFELYQKAMVQAGASVNSIEQFVKALKDEHTLQEAFDIANAPEAASGFVRHTFEIIDLNKPHVLAAVFTFGREDLIPNMFLSIVNDLGAEWQESFSVFKYYLERHIEVDGDHHSHLAMAMTEELLGNDSEKWAEATEAVKSSLKQRIALWDGVLNQIEQSVSLKA